VDAVPAELCRAHGRRIGARCATLRCQPRISHAGHKVDGIASAVVTELENRGIRAANPSISFPMEIYQTDGGAIWVVSHKPVAVQAGLEHVGIRVRSVDRLQPVPDVQTVRGRVSRGRHRTEGTATHVVLTKCRGAKD
jgi:hypothetical protein